MCRHGEKENYTMLFTPQDPTPVYREAPAYTVNTPSGRIDFTMRSTLQEMRTAPKSK